MAARYTVYCRRCAAEVTADELLAGVGDADLHTIAEGNDISDDVILAALNQLRIENLDSSGFRFYRLCYRPDGMRQIDVKRWQTPGEVEAVIGEVLADLEARNHPVLERLRPLLNQTVDIVDASFGSSPDEEMAPVLASEVTRWLAEKFDGVIRAADDSWWKLGQHNEYRQLQ